MPTHGVYALYVPSAVKPVTGLVMERFPSREVCGQTLKIRLATGSSRLFTDPSGRWMPPASRPLMEWPVFDETGYMRVWTSWTGDDFPGLLSRPDEEWVVSESGKVERLAWADSETDELYLANGGAWANSRLTK
jgi:hypothetical protein